VQVMIKSNGVDRGPDKDIPGSPLRYERQCIMVFMRKYYVYILTNKRNGTLYVGMAGKLGKRVVRHKDGGGSKFVQKYKTHRLVYFEKVTNYIEARKRERQLKWWKRKWKLALIEQTNPECKDLSKEILDPG